MSIDAARLSRADRRLLAKGAQPAGDLMITKIGNRIYVGVRDGGRVAMRPADARDMAAALLELAD